MTNPSNAVGTNAAYGGRTSVNAFNDSLAAYSRGIISGWACAPSSGLTVVLGGSGTARDVAVAEDNAGNKTSIDNISGSPISVTMSAAPGANSRIDAIVAYVDNPPQGSSTVVDNYGACGLIAVSGTAAANPVAPNDSAIRSAITADGASGTTAYYVVLAYVTLAAGTTDIDASMISNGVSAMNNSYSLDEQATGYTWIDGTMIYKKTVKVTSITSNTDMSINHGISNLGTCIKIEGVGDLDNGTDRMIPGGTSTHTFTVGNVTSSTFSFYSTLGTAGTYYFTLYYTKN